MANNTDLILGANNSPDNEWDELTRYDVDTLLRVSQKKIDTVVKQGDQSQKTEKQTKEKS